MLFLHLSTEPGQVQKLFLQLLTCVQHCRVLTHHSTAFLQKVWSIPPRHLSLSSYSELISHQNEGRKGIGQRPTLLWSACCYHLQPETSAGLEMHMSGPLRLQFPPVTRTSIKAPSLVGTGLEQTWHSVPRKTCVLSFLSSFQQLKSLFILYHSEPEQHGKNNPLVSMTDPRLTCTLCKNFLFIVIR